MSDVSAAAVLAVIYARNLGQVVEFYRRTLSLPVTQKEDAYVILGDGRFEVAVVDMVCDGAAAVAPVQRREHAAIKPSFLIDDLARVRLEVEAPGGTLKPPSAVWPWRGQLHLDGTDPEGNVVQFRQREPG
jgi:predicted enzyme related to lactoylglutathione lyase